MLYASSGVDGDARISMLVSLPQAERAKPSILSMALCPPGKGIVANSFTLVAFMIASVSIFLYSIGPRGSTR